MMVFTIYFLKHCSIRYDLDGWSLWIGSLFRRNFTSRFPSTLIKNIKSDIEWKNNVNFVFLPASRILARGSCLASRPNCSRTWLATKSSSATVKALHSTTAWSKTLNWGMLPVVKVSKSDFLRQMTSKAGGRGGWEENIYNNLHITSNLRDPRIHRHFYTLPVQSYYLRQWMKFHKETMVPWENRSATVTICERLQEIHHLGLAGYHPCVSQWFHSCK